MWTRSTRSFERQMAQATSYAEWAEAARAHDRASGAERWKDLERSRRYDYASIRARLETLHELRRRNDNVGLLFTLNEGLHGNMGGMGNARLYAPARFGTKALISDYVAQINEALLHLASPNVDEISLEDKLEFFRRASHCYGHTALMMSGSGSLLYFHVGVVKALWDEKLLPDVLSGSSGGAIIAGIVGTHEPEQLGRMFEPDFLLSEVRQESRVWSRLSSLKPRRLAPGQIREVIERLIPDLTFQEAEQRTGRQINVSVAPAETHQSSRLLNAIASPNVYIHEGLMASAAVPGVYPPVMLMARNVNGVRQPYLPTRRWVDGSVTDDLPAKRLARLYSVNHFIVSQTNPLALPFVHDSTNERTLLEIYRHAAQRSAREWINAHMDALHRPLSRRPVLERWATMARSLINQQYTADINIIPNSRLMNPAKLLSLRSEQEVMDMILAGQLATWPKVEMIRIQTMISATLKKILTDLHDGEVATFDRRLKPRDTPTPTRRSSKARKTPSTRKIAGVA